MALSSHKADLHIHTCLSPCGDLDMSPRRIVHTAAEKGLSIIAVCDHNSAENAAAAVSAAGGDGQGLYVLCGIEVCSVEEVHILGLFSSPQEARLMQEIVYRALGPETNRPEIFGQQVEVNEFDEVEGFNQRLLISATGLTVEEVADAIHEIGGLAVASHIDRPAFSLLGQLGFIPPGLRLDALEASPQCDLHELLDKHPESVNHPIICNSDAHFLHEIGSAYTQFLIESLTWKEMVMAFKNQNGRSLHPGPRPETT